MPTNTAGYSSAYADYLKDAAEAVGFNDPNWHDTAVTREQQKRLRAAREKLAQSLPPEGTEADLSAREEALGQLATHDADSVAVADNQWAKLQVLLDNGRQIQALIAQGDRRRLGAVLDHVEELAMQSGDLEGVRREVENLVIDRLAALGDEKAVKAQAAATAAAHDSAWRQVIEDATRGEVGVAPRTLLRRASVADYDAAFPDTDEARASAQAVARLDRMAPIPDAEGTSGNAAS